MARITRFDRVNKERHVVHSETACNYSVFTDERGTRYLQLDTIGSTDRKIVGKVSQSVQFDERAARGLLGLLMEAFPGLTRETE